MKTFFTLRFGQFLLLGTFGLMQACNPPSAGLSSEISNDAASLSASKNTLDVRLVWEGAAEPSHFEYFSVAWVDLDAKKRVGDVMTFERNEQTAKYNVTLPDAATPSGHYALLRATQEVALPTPMPPGTVMFSPNSLQMIEITPSKLAVFKDPNGHTPCLNESASNPNARIYVNLFNPSQAASADMLQYLAMPATMSVIVQRTPSSDSNTYATTALILDNLTGEVMGKSKSNDNDAPPPAGKTVETLNLGQVVNPNGNYSLLVVRIPQDPSTRAHASNPNAAMQKCPSLLQSFAFNPIYSLLKVADPSDHAHDEVPNQDGKVVYIQENALLAAPSSENIANCKFFP